MQRKKYQTSRLEIRPLTKKDFKRWVIACELSPDSKSKFDSPPPSDTSLIFFTSMLESQKKNAKEDSTYVWWLVNKKDSEIVGVIDIHIIVRDDLLKANLGYHIFNRYWRKGYAKEALKKLCKETLRDLKINRLEAIIDFDNYPSIKLVKNLGFHKEGIRKHYWYQNGRWEDQIAYSITRNDFRLPKIQPS